jgi:ArsR family transcriptional regulator
MEEQNVIRTLSALAHPLRLQLFRALVGAGPQGLTPGVLGEQLQAAATTLSFHLKELTAAQLITQERDGRHLIYRADFERMAAVMSYLTAHCCQGQPCEVTAAKPACC